MLSKTPWTRYLIALLIACHGFVYLRFEVPAPNQVLGWRDSSWITGGALSGDGLKVALSALHIAAGILIIGCGVAIGLGSIASGWWRPLAIAGAASGLAGFALFLDGQPQLVLQEGGIGAAISAALLVGAIVLAPVLRRHGKPEGVVSG